MSFSPFARFRNFTLDNLKAILEVYPDEAKTMKWSEAANEIEKMTPGYKKTSYQQACQFGLEDRGNDYFRIQNYLFTFDDENLKRYIEFWIKTYYAPNPYVRGNDRSFIIYCEIVREILSSSNHEIKFYDFFNNRIGGKSDDILLNAIKNYGEPVRIKKINGDDILYILDKDIIRAKDEINYIEVKMPIQNPKDRKDFFDRFSYDNFCKFFGIEKKIEEIMAESNRKKIIYHTGYQSEFSRNRIVFGAPGTGKSYILNKEKDFLLRGNLDNYERVTFHPNYSYANFVGSYKPVSTFDKEGKDIIRYEYVPGPFMRIYVKALKNINSDERVKPYLLLIEEINRANVSAVFGEIFQLLDRSEDNVSEYVIQTSEDVKKYLAKELKCDVAHMTEIRIPDNMFIWATMNSADQGVFPMDTAFKRRWDFTYMGIDDGADKIKDYIIPIGNQQNRKYVYWNDLRSMINNILCSEQCRVNEDKLLGPFFISKNMLKNATSSVEAENNFVKLFESKVIMYLFEDVMKMRPQNIFAGHNGRMTFSEICRSFEVNCEKIFGSGELKIVDKITIEQKR